MSSAMLKPAGLSQSELCKRNGRSVPAITPVEPNTNAITRINLALRYLSDKGKVGLRKESDGLQGQG
jgi:hypothetical protein